MATNIFYEGRRTVPKDTDPQILHQDLSQQEMGARKSAMPKIPKNSLTIKHVNK